MSRRRKLLFGVILSLFVGIRAVSFEAALFAAPQKPRSNHPKLSLPRTVRFRDVRGRGLLANVWVNSAGPYIFAIDTGAGATLVSQRVASEARLYRSGRDRSVAGLSGAAANASEAKIQTLALGDRDNFLPGRSDVVVTSGLPADLDGVLDPTEAFSPLGYVIDIPRNELSAFDPHDVPINLSRPPAGGATVSWLREPQGRRPFVQLDNGDRALIDTGSSLGLAIRDYYAANSNHGSLVRDIGGGQVSTRRVRPRTIAIGPLALRNVPTDLISGSEADAPVLLGLSALRPFKLTFDPLHHLIEIVPVDRRRI